MARTTVPLASTAISMVEWDPDDMNAQTIEVTFNNGNSYTHVGVPHNIVQGLLDATSAGRYYAANLKGKFRA